MKPILLLFTVAAIGAAQEPPDVHVRVATGEAQKVIGVVPRQVEFLSMEFGDARVVKNAPYSAEAITENTQVLADGNRIYRKNTATVYRDSQGRTRREQTLTGIGPWAAANEPLQSIFIHDPVAGVSYALDPRTKTAQKMPSPGATVEGQVLEGVIGGIVSSAAFGATGHAGAAVQIQQHVVAHAAGPSEGKTESLGKRMFDGVEAEGTRETTTIPAGQIGNDGPIEIASERWFSAQLKTVVYSKRTDPRMGETVYKLTNISRTEPLASLFQVPADYTIKEGPGTIQFMKKLKAEEPK